MGLGVSWKLSSTAGRPEKERGGAVLSPAGTVLSLVGINRIEILGPLLRQQFASDPEVAGSGLRPEEETYGER